MNCILLNSVNVKIKTIIKTIVLLPISPYIDEDKMIFITLVIGILR